MRPSVDWSGWILASLLALAACGSSSGSGETDASEGGHAEASDAHAHDAPHDVAIDHGDSGDGEVADCNACLASYCSAELASCARFADCLAIVECAGDKVDPAGCICAHPAGASAYVDFASCKLAQACSSGCQSSCLSVTTQSSCDLAEAGIELPSCDGGLSGSEANAPDCSGCIDVNCAEQDSRCGPGSDCLAYETCVFGCGADDPGCPGACQAEHPEGYGYAQSLFDCEEGTCWSPCGLSPP
jgi:hypothetical protein